MVNPAWLVKAFGWVSGINLSKLKPLIPYVAVGAVVFMYQEHRYDAKKVKGDLRAKDTIIEQERTKAQTQRDLVTAKNEVIAEWKSMKADSDDRIGDLEQNNLDLLNRTPKDTLKIIDNTRKTADAIISKDKSYSWLHSPYPDVMRDNTNRRIRASKEYGLPIPALAGDRRDRPDTKD